MLAQRSHAAITAIEPDDEAFELARENFQSAAFAERMHIQHIKLQDFDVDKLFDLIVCNPPFFQNSLKPPKANRQQQRHADSLPPAQLLEHVSRLLSFPGRFCVVLPTEEGNRFMELAENQKLYLTKSSAVFSKTGKFQERWLLEFGKQAPPHIEKNTLTIMNHSGQWTDEYKSLTKDFYLNF
jgi:tRNA1Val (adenine37-N6)-methyltransferase